jgi:hypothetical protein
VKKSEWSDKQLIELLRQMPKIQDHRDPRDIFKNLSIKKRKYPIWVIPSIAAAAALFIAIILFPKLVNQPQNSYDSAGQQKISSVKMADSSSKLQSSLQNKQDSLMEKKDSSATAQPRLLKAVSLKTAIYADEVKDGTVLTYWIPDKQAQLLIPVSTIVNEDKQKSWITVFNEEMSALKEKEWGLTDYYPINASLTVDETNNAVKVDVPVNHTYGQGSNNETIFLDILKRDIAANSPVRKIMFYTSGKRGIDLGNFGKMETVNINDDIKHAYFFYYTKGDETPFIVPSSEQYGDISSALSDMEKDRQTNGLKASLPSKYIKEIVIKENTLYVTLNPNLQVKDDSQTLHSFEALLFAAKDFGMEKVYINNSPIKILGPFDLTKEVEVPIAPNYRSLQ